MVPRERFELPTLRLQGVCTTVVLARHMDYEVRFTLTREIFPIYYLHPLDSGLASYYQNIRRLNGSLFYGEPYHTPKSPRTKHMRIYIMFSLGREA